jgi:hypothetical protein
MATTIVSNAFPAGEYPPAAGRFGYPAGTAVLDPPFDAGDYPVCDDPPDFAAICTCPFGTIPPAPPAPPVVPATGANAGIPGTWTPSGSTPPADAAGAAGIVANPTTPWTTGQYVQGTTAGAAGRMTWSGTGWVGGVAP